MTQSYCDPQQLAKFRLHTHGHQGNGKGADFSDYTAFESMLELAARGWSYEQRPGSKKLSPYKAGCQKMWYYSKQICRHYLQVLLLADDLFSLGLQQIYHYQSTSYYKALVFMMQHPAQLNIVKPWQTLDYYKILQQRAHKKPTMRDRLESEDGGGKQIC